MNIERKKNSLLQPAYDIECNIVTITTQHFLSRSFRNKLLVCKRYETTQSLQKMLFDMRSIKSRLLLSCVHFYLLRQKVQIDEL